MALIIKINIIIKMFDGKIYNIESLLNYSNSSINQAGSTNLLKNKIIGGEISEKFIRNETLVEVINNHF